jgi:sortase A
MKQRATTLLLTLGLLVGVFVVLFSAIQIREQSLAMSAQLPAMSLAFKSSSNPSTVLSEGDYLGTISIPSIGLKAGIYEGTGDDQLKKGVGHYRQSVLPGESDNSVLSAHRDTFFSKLGRVAKGDEIVINMGDRSYLYIINRSKIVARNDRTVIVPTPTATLTLSTCYPFNYVGAAPKRFIVTALLKSGNPKSESLDVS